LYGLKKRVEKLAYCVHHTMSKNPKHLPNFLRRAETSIALIGFLYGILCEVRAYGTPCEVRANTVTVSYHWSTRIRYQKSYILVSDRIQSMQFDCSNRTSAGYIKHLSMKWNGIQWKRPEFNIPILSKEWVSDCCLTPKNYFFSSISRWEQVTFDEIIIMSALY